MTKTAPQITTGATYDQHNMTKAGLSKRPVRMVKALEIKGETVMVRALNGPLAGCEYEVKPEVLR